jgi:hypothetical protein
LVGWRSEPSWWGGGDGEWRLATDERGRSGGLCLRSARPVNGLPGGNATPTGELRKVTGLTRPGSDVDMEAQGKKKQAGRAANCARKISSCLLRFALR